MSTPIADDYAGIAAGMREDGALATREDYAVMKFSPISPAFIVTSTRAEWLADAADDYALFRFVQEILGRDDMVLEKAAATEVEAFTTLAETLAERMKKLTGLAWAAQVAHMRLLCVLSRLEEREGEACDDARGIVGGT